jgi:hypothetical protein
VRIRTAVEASAPFALSAVLFGCVPPGNSTPSDAGTTIKSEPATPTFRASPNVMTAVFDDNFERANTPAAASASSGSAASAGSAASLGSAATGASAASATAAKIDGSAAISAKSDGAPATVGSASSAATGDDAAPPSTLGPDWTQAGTSAWRIENGRLCGANAHNHGVWLNRTLPVNARIEFDAISDVQDGDLKAEVWGDGRSAATSISYTNATSYLTILGGWHNKFHVLARINEHGTDRKEIKVDNESDDPTQKPVTAGQVYHFKIERTDGKTVKWAVNGIEYLDYVDSQPLTGLGHDHFGFNDWEAKVCFDNVKVTPL